MDYIFDLYKKRVFSHFDSTESANTMVIVHGSLPYRSTYPINQLGDLLNPSTQRLRIVLHRNDRICIIWVQGYPLLQFSTNPGPHKCSFLRARHKKKPVSFSYVPKYWHTHTHTDMRTSYMLLLTDPTSIYSRFPGASLMLKTVVIDQWQNVHREKGT